MRDPHHIHKNIMVMMRMTMIMVLKAERQVDADHSFVLQLLRLYIIKCVSLFTFYRFQAIKCARRQLSTFYGIEIGKK